MTTETHSDPRKAVLALQRLYGSESGRLRSAFNDFIQGRTPDGRIRAFYPLLRARIENVQFSRITRSYGFCEQPGVYETTVTRPDLFERYLSEQLAELSSNHDCSFETLLSDVAMPVHFAFPDGLHVERGLSTDQLNLFGELFDAPDLATMDDQLVNGEREILRGEANPLSLFSAPRIDYSLHRLLHYTGTDCRHFQNFVLFTNYQFYVDGFRELAGRGKTRKASR